MMTSFIRPSGASASSWLPLIALFDDKVQSAPVVAWIATVPTDREGLTVGIRSGSLLDRDGRFPP